VDDAELLDRARRGDEAAFAHIFARHQRSIYRYAAHMCGREMADDVVQETFLVVLRGLHRYDPDRSPVAGYLFGIARHVVMKRMARARSAPTAPLDDAPVDLCHDGESVLDELTRREAVDAVRSAVRSLPPAYREVVVLCELEGFDYATAAGVLQCPIGTIRSRLHRARALLSAKLMANRRLLAVGGN
jgi:RNA polymerase sigma-70 factor (ECF subfamily)